MKASLAIIIIIRHQSGHHRPVSASSNCLFKGRPSRIHPPDPQFSIIFAILLLFILATCRSHSDLYLLSYLLAMPVFRELKFGLGMPDTDASDTDTERGFPICAEASSVFDFAILSSCNCGLVSCNMADNTAGCSLLCSDDK
jgi:hypothetical protein